MNTLDAFLTAALLIVLALAAYVDRIYSEMGKFLARNYQDNIDSWEERVEPRMRLGRESLAQSASVLRQALAGRGGGAGGHAPAAQPAGDAQAWRSGGDLGRYRPRRAGAGAADPDL